MATTQKNSKRTLRDIQFSFWETNLMKAILSFADAAAYPDGETAITSEESQPSLKVNKSEGTGLFSSGSLTLDPLSFSQAEAF